LRHVVRSGEAIGDSKRDPLDQAFDAALGGTYLPTMKRALVAELAGLDGAIVLANKGRLLAYGAILEPRKKGRVRGTEGSRTKAAIGASKYGLALKVSSDGDISVFVKGKKLIVV
jgi:DNA integrity scanning protein DisA with diadenylate cyclase activity